MPAQTVKSFVQDSYQLISPGSPTVPLFGDDMSKGIQFMNELLEAYSATGLMLTIAKEIFVPIINGQSLITFGQASYVPTPDVTLGRLANLQNAWLLLQGVTYPLIIENRNTFLASYKFDPQLGLPRFAIVFNQTDLTTVRLYPGASQGYEFHAYGKFQLDELTENDDMSSLPVYYKRYLKLGLAKELSFYKARTQAWTDKLEEHYLDAKKDMESVSSVNLNIETEQESYLNGSWRVRAGV